MNLNHLVATLCRIASYISSAESVAPERSPLFHSSRPYQGSRLFEEGERLVIQNAVHFFTLIRTTSMGMRRNSLGNALTKGGTN